MNMFEEAQTVAGMIGMCKMTQREIAKKLGTSQSYIANKMRLLRFSEPMRRQILEAKISERHARELLRLSGEEAQKRALSRIVEGKMNVAVTEILVDRLVAEEACEKGNSKTTTALPCSEADEAARATRGENGVEAFLKSVDCSLLGLRSEGVFAELSVRRSNGTTMLTIAIGA